MRYKWFVLVGDTRNYSALYKNEEEARADLEKEMSKYYGDNWTCLNNVQYIATGAYDKGWGAYVEGMLEISYTEEEKYLQCLYSSLRQFCDDAVNSGDTKLLELLEPVIEYAYKALEIAHQEDDR